MATTYTGVQRVTVGPDETTIELHDATEGQSQVRLSPMAVQELLEALAHPTGLNTSAEALTLEQQLHVPA